VLPRQYLFISMPRFSPKSTYLGEPGAALRLKAEPLACKPCAAVVGSWVSDLILWGPSPPRNAAGDRTTGHRQSNSCKQKL
jgi:hypothetical protein